VISRRTAIGGAIGGGLIALLAPQLVDLPAGAIAMKFTPKSNTVSVPDGCGGEYLQGTYELNIPEARGRYRSFVGGHNRMVDNLHFLESGDADEFCVCLISRPPESSDD
jgi:hypothetical protein